MDHNRVVEADSHADPVDTRNKCPQMNCSTVTGDQSKADNPVIIKFILVTKRKL